MPAAETTPRRKRRAPAAAAAPDPLAEIRLPPEEQAWLLRACSAPVAAALPPPAAQAFLAWQAVRITGRTVIWVTDGPRTLDTFFQAAQALAPAAAAPPAIFPAETDRPGSAAAPEMTGDRLDALRRCLSPAPPPVVATCVQALLRPLAAPEDLLAQRRMLAVGAPQTPDELMEWLAARDYTCGAEAQLPGEAARRGGIVDFWPPSASHPYRVEFSGNVIESLRTFDPLEQRSLQRCETIEALPARETGGRADLADYLPEALWVWADPPALASHAALQAQHAPTGMEWLAWRARHDARRPGGLSLWSGGIADDPALGAAAPAVDFSIAAITGLPALTEGAWEPDRLAELRRRLVEEWLAAARRGNPTLFFFETPGARDRFCETWPDRPPACAVRLGALPAGFRAGAAGLTVVAENDLYGRPRAARGRYDPHGARAAARHAVTAGPRPADWRDMQPGELVVHVEHGIGRYEGLREIRVAGNVQETLAVAYADNARLFVPLDQAHLLSRYIGFGKAQPELHRLGGARWQKEKQAAAVAVRDLAADLLRVQAIRQTAAGHACRPDTHWQRELEAGFPWTETDDQARAIAEVKRDLESPRPMDRLICGDVGYGKTEVALRAAFKIVMDGKQAAVLVPTTVLAQQHYDSFCARLAAFPVTVEMLSRFRTPGEQTRTLARLRAGATDIVIGTHRLAQPDVAFKDLGLVIIDEEQRFGVAHKEALKRLRETVDVLTLTATPIPRTLYLSLSGARDLSVIQTPPQERLPVETIVSPHDDRVVRDAILRELNREGQVFYLHNRVRTIDHAHFRLAQLAPEARIRVAHGQMGEKALAETMRAFVRGDFDVLLCTTIIESGVDIPNVNTILIDRADRFGLAELYQLRGRVGRARQQGYAYLLLPRHGRLLDIARQRIGALRRHAGLGAGFQLALRDLELRGAGNILGAEQSGHIAAVGFDLYCGLLRRAVAQLKGEPPPSVIATRLRLDFLPPDAATLPIEYVEDENHRVDIFRRIAALADETETAALRAELRDRFGPLPREAERLLRLADLRIRAQRNGIGDVETRDGRVLLRRGADYLQTDGRMPRLKKDALDDRLDELSDLIRNLTHPA